MFVSPPLPTVHSSLQNACSYVFCSFLCACPQIKADRRQRLLSIFVRGDTERAAETAGGTDRERWWKKRLKREREYILYNGHEHWLTDRLDKGNEKGREGKTERWETEREKKKRQGIYSRDGVGEKGRWTKWEWVIGHIMNWWYQTMQWMIEKSNTCRYNKYCRVTLSRLLPGSDLSVSSPNIQSVDIISVSPPTPTPVHYRYT